jgi:hypothetical protein
MNNPDPAQDNPEVPTQESGTDTQVPMVAVTLRSVMLSYNHLLYAFKAGSFNSLSINEVKSVVDNIAMLKSFIPESLRGQVE